MSNAQAADIFLVSSETIRNWRKALHDKGATSLLTTRSAINRFPDFVCEIVDTLAETYPTLSSRRIADILCRAGLHIAATTVRRFRQRPAPKTNPSTPRTPCDAAATAAGDAAPAAKTVKTVTARYPNHLWHIDITQMPIFHGFAVPWMPFSIGNHWPWCWHIVVVYDHFSRAVLAIRAFEKEPSGDDACNVLDEAVQIAGRAPKHIVSDQGRQFISDAYDTWYDDHGVAPRFGALDKHGALAVLERFHRSLKQEWLRRILVPVDVDQMNTALGTYAYWHNAHRPHSALFGATPREVFERTVPAHCAFGFEIRPGYPLENKIRTRRGIKKMQRAKRLRLVTSTVDGHPELPVVAVERAA